MQHLKETINEMKNNWWKNFYPEFDTTNDINPEYCGGIFYENGYDYNSVFHINIDESPEFPEILCIFYDNNNIPHFARVILPDEDGNGEGCYLDEIYGFARSYSNNESYTGDFTVKLNVDTGMKFFANIYGKTK